VDIVGSGFEGPATVLIGGSPAQVLSVSPTRIRVRTPPFVGDPGPSGTPVAVSVTIRAGASNSATATLANAFFYTRGSGDGFIPSIASVTPVNGPNEGGTLVTINGGGFQAPVQVFFEVGTVGVEAQIQSVSSSRIVVTSPSATGFGSVLRDQQVNIRVRNLGTGLEAVAANAFRYGVVIRITSISPNTGPATGGTLVTIFGEGFDEPVAVSFGGIAQQVISVTGTEIVVRTVPVTVTGCGAGAGGPVTVTNIETSATATGPAFNYQGPPEPIITNVQPASGPASGGTVVTITGSNFDPPARVTFGAQAGNVTATSPTSITVTTPPFAGGFDSVACDDTPGDGQAGTRQVPEAVDVTVTNLDTSCTDTLVGAFSYLPPDASCVGDDPPPPDPPVAAFTGICNAANLTCSFADTSTGTVSSRAWEFGDPASGANNNSSSPTPSHTFSTPNQGYLVRLTVTNAGGSSSAVHTVTCGATGCVFTP
jgi:PKD repeat protein